MSVRRTFFLLLSAAAALRVPILLTPHTLLPLDKRYLTLSEDAYNELDDISNQGRCLVGLMRAPRGERSAPVGACGVLCQGGV